jgi:hypothetical protein
MAPAGPGLQTDREGDGPPALADHPLWRYRPRRSGHAACPKRIRSGAAKLVDTCVYALANGCSSPRPRLRMYGACDRPPMISRERGAKAYCPGLVEPSAALFERGKRYMPTVTAPRYAARTPSALHYVIDHRIGCLANRRSDLGASLQHLGHPASLLLLKPIQMPTGVARGNCD